MTATVTPIAPERPTKRCWRCEKLGRESQHPLADFNQDRHREDGRQAICRPCSKEVRIAYLAAHPGAQKRAFAKWYANPENRAKTTAAIVRHRRERATLLINRFKAAPCMDCGKTFPTCAMDFDHRPGAEKCFNVGYQALGGRPLEDIIAEIAKCDLVCACCHRIRTNTRGQCGQRGKVEG